MSTDLIASHFMLGFVGGYDQAEFVSDIKLAHSRGIDGFVSLHVNRYLY